MAENIYVMDEQKNLEPLEESRFEQEDHLQALIADHPGLLAGEQVRPDRSRAAGFSFPASKGFAETPGFGTSIAGAVDLFLS